MAPHGLCRAPQRCVYVMPCGSNIDVARCGWEFEIKSNGKEMFRFAQHDVSATEVAPPKNMQNHKRFHVSLRASGASVAIDRQRQPKRIPIRWIASLTLAMPMVN
ncbi:MAG: hypothetical protein K2N54_08980, partial [Helicobacter sp.]|nr:hypothetical protein [Helicobacter sp.]